MTDIIGYWLSGLIVLGITLIGARFFLAPQAAAPLATMRAGRLTFRRKRCATSRAVSSPGSSF